MQIAETASGTSARIRNGRIAIILSVSYWLATVGGIILMTNLYR